MQLLTEGFWGSNANLKGHFSRSLQDPAKTVAIGAKRMPIDAYIRYTYLVYPTAPSATFDAPQFLQTVQNLENQAVQHGWITDLGVAKSIDAKLTAAGAALKEHEADDAREILHALLHEIS